MRFRCINRLYLLFADILDSCLEIRRRLRYTNWPMENPFFFSIIDPIIQDTTSDFVLGPFDQLHFSPPSGGLPSPIDHPYPPNRTPVSGAQAVITSPNKKRRVTNNPVGRRGRLMCTPCRHKHKGRKVHKTLFEGF